MSESKRSVSPWLPVSLLAVTTAALTVPIVLFRKQRAVLLTRSLSNSPAPPRRAGSSSLKLFPSKPQQHSYETVPVEVAKTAECFSPRLHAAKALGIATLLVMASSVTAIWGVRSLLNVNTTQDFAELARRTIHTKMPEFSSRIYRPTDLTEDERLLLEDRSADQNWTWPAAEARLTEAFAEGGFTRWMQVAFNELEAEARLERWKRIRSQSNRESDNT